MRRGWTTATLGDLVDFYSGGTPAKSKPEYWQGAVPWFSAKDMKAPRLADSIDHVSENVFTQTPLRRIPAGTIAMVVRGMILAHTVPISILDRDCAINQDLKALIPRRPVDTTFLAAMIRAQHDKILADVSHAAHGTTKLESHVLANIEVPLPPLDEQRRIAAILDHVDAISARRRKTIAHLEELVHSVFEQTTSSNDSILLGDVAEEFRYGTSEKSAPTGTPTLRIPNVVGGRLDLTDVRVVPVEERAIQRLALRDGDILFVRSNGNAGHIGRSAIFHTDRTRGTELEGLPIAFASYLIRMRPALNSVVPEFIHAYLSSPTGRRALLSTARTSAGQYNVNIEGLRNLELPFVPLETQKIFAVRVNEICQARLAAERHLTTLKVLFESLQARAFAGELNVADVRLPNN